MLNETLNDDAKLEELLDYHEVEYEEIGDEQREKAIELTKLDAAKIAYYRISSEYGIKYNVKDMDWIKSAIEGFNKSILGVLFCLGPVPQDL